MLEVESRGLFIYILYLFKNLFWSMTLIMWENASGVLFTSHELQRIVLRSTKTCEGKGLDFTLGTHLSVPSTASTRVSGSLPGEPASGVMKLWILGDCTGTPEERAPGDVTPDLRRFWGFFLRVRPRSLSFGAPVIQETASHWFKPPTYRRANFSPKTTLCPTHTYLIVFSTKAETPTRAPYSQWGRISITLL